MAEKVSSTIKTIIKSIVVTAGANGKLSSEMVERKKHARDFLRTLSRRVELQSVIESQAMTPEQYVAKESAKPDVRFVNRRLEIACFSYGLPNDYNILDDTLFELYGIRADEISKYLK